MTLQHLMIMRRIDRVCARMNAGLTAVAIALSLAVSIAAAIQVTRTAGIFNQNQGSGFVNNAPAAANIAVNASIQF